MKSCDDHPDNIAVEICEKCDKYICGLHDSGLCNYHQNSSAIAGKPLMIILSIVATGLVFFVIGAIISLFDDFTTYSSEGIDITTTSETNQFPDLMTIIMVFFAVAIPLLIFIAIILIRLSNTDVGSISISKVKMRSSSYYCQNCGQELNMSHDQCIRCGKNTDEEKKLIS